jgi:probable phosphoglycerate mutase
VEVFVARHGETDWNREGRYQGRLDSSRLTALGVEQARALATALRDRRIERIVCSPLQRCAQTAEAIAAELRLPVVADDRLIEIGHGTWEGQMRWQIERSEPERFRSWRSHPETVHFENGESLEQVRTRWREFASGLPAKGNVAVVTHDVLVRVAILNATETALTDFWRPAVVNGAFARLRIRDGRWTLLDECVADHLAGRLADIQVQAL